jgi:hypothetical protein
MLCDLSCLDEEDPACRCRDAEARPEPSNASATPALAAAR